MCSSLENQGGKYQDDEREDPGTRSAFCHPGIPAAAALRRSVLQPVQNLTELHRGFILARNASLLGTLVKGYGNSINDRRVGVVIGAAGRRCVEDSKYNLSRHVAYTRL